MKHYNIVKLTVVMALIVVAAFMVASGQSNNIPVAKAQGTGTFAYIANRGGNTVSVIDTSTNSVVDTVTVGGNPRGVAVNPAGTRVYVANDSSGTVSVIDSSTNNVVDTVTVGSNPFSLGQFIGPMTFSCT